MRAYKATFLGLLTILVWSCSPPSNERETAAPAGTNSQADTGAPLSSYSMAITSSVKELQGKPGEALTVPVTLVNIGRESWPSEGKFPVTLSYKWFDGDKMLPIEGERTVLPRTVKPGERLALNAKVVVPEGGSDLTVKLTLVQEGVAWFFLKGGTPLEIPFRFR